MPAHRVESSQHRRRRRRRHNALSNALATQKESQRSYRSLSHRRKADDYGDWATIPICAFARSLACWRRHSNLSCAIGSASQNSSDEQRRRQLLRALASSLARRAAHLCLERADRSRARRSKNVERRADSAERRTSNAEKNVPFRRRPLTGALTLAANVNSSAFCPPQKELIGGGGGARRNWPGA